MNDNLFKKNLNFYTNVFNLLKNFSLLRITLRIACGPRFDHKWGWLYCI